MPSHQARRDPLPDGYQFGDAAVYGFGWGLERYIREERADRERESDPGDERRTARTLRRREA